jgi:hypothetical protein
MQHCKKAVPETNGLSLAFSLKVIGMTIAPPTFRVNEPQTEIVLIYGPGSNGAIREETEQRRSHQRNGSAFSFL